MGCKRGVSCGDSLILVLSQNSSGLRPDLDWKVSRFIGRMS